LPSGVVCKFEDRVALLELFHVLEKELCDFEVAAFYSIMQGCAVIEFFGHDVCEREKM